MTTMIATAARTQKARGIIALRKLSFGPHVSMLPSYRPFYIVTSDDDITHLQHSDTFLAELCTEPIFARPCPTRPRHGFVESRDVYNIDDIVNVWREARAVDPEAELILCRKFKAEFNAVCTPNLLTIGLGHDGATSGRDAITFPACGLKIDSNVLSMAGISDTPYIEVVYTRVDTNIYDRIITQLRDGPAIAIASPDLVFHTTVVRKIIDVRNNMSLLDWERLIESIKEENGTVVYHRGGALTSHFGVHCALHHVPYITSRRPTLGEILAPTTDAQELDLHEVARGIRAGLPIAATVCDAKSMARAALYCLHAFPLLTKHESVFLGLSIANTIKLAVTACIGELRHTHTHTHKLHRSSVYAYVLEHPQHGLENIRIARNVFRSHRWPSGYGGKNWAKCASVTIQLLNRALQFARKPSNARLIKVMEAYNRLVNIVHNNAPLLSKFISTQMLDLASYDITEYAVVSAPYLYTEYRRAERLGDSELIVAPLWKWGEAERTRLRDYNWRGYYEIFKNKNTEQQANTNPNTTIKFHYGDAQFALTK